MVEGTGYGLGMLANNVVQLFDGLRPNELDGVKDQDLRRTTDNIALQDSFELFKYWTGQFGVVHQPQDPRSFDHRLRNVPAIARRMQEVLRELISLLRDKPSSHLELHRPTVMDDPLVAELLDPSTTLVEGHNSWLIASISDAVRRLFRLSIHVTRSHGKDHYASAEASAEARFDELYDIMHVTEYVNARRGQAASQQWLLDRLGKAITKRREFIRYCRLHQQKLAKTSMSTAPASSSEAKQSKTDPIEASSYQPERTNTAPSRPSMVLTKATTVLPNSDFVDDDLDDRDNSTIATSTRSEQGANLLRIPSMSDYGLPGVPFDCPYCSKPQQFQGNSGWRPANPKARKHARSDLRPYVCTFEDCGLAMFQDRHTWQDHEMQRHRRIWHCGLCNSEPLGSSSSLRSHFQQSHVGHADDERLDALLNAGSRPVESIFPSQCPICDWEPEIRRLNAGIQDCSNIAVTVPQFMKHLAGHLEQLALFAVPRESPEGTKSNAAGAKTWNDSSSRPSSSLSSRSMREEATPSAADANPIIGGSDVARLEQQNIDSVEEVTSVKARTSAWLAASSSPDPPTNPDGDLSATDRDSPRKSEPMRRSALLSADSLNRRDVEESQVGNGYDTTQPLSRTARGLDLAETGATSRATTGRYIPRAPDVDPISKSLQQQRREELPPPVLHAGRPALSYNAYGSHTASERRLDHPSITQSAPASYTPMEPKQRPWICTHPYCSSANRFRTMDDLESHRMAVHQLAFHDDTAAGNICFLCKLTNPRVYCSWARQADFEAHIRQQHPEGLLNYDPRDLRGASYAYLARGDGIKPHGDDAF